ncbi:MAG: hypothetical protein K8R18_03850 [Parvibaculum sp.]|uniref:antibiotic biosynthesis monooxygenase family protein n=1 Tax=Parvibaculum sp. TaxID=2024848 RepID=UPI0025FB0119|nr:antibiotic biosynthesis monooxygenase [Parvibaculum sp.]MCE9648741.1 hypothetical protein [Parvibaculum sp.]
MTRTHSSARVARTPRPPYYAVTTTTELLPEYDQEKHISLGAELYGHAQQIGGFYGLEAFFENGASIAVSYWDSLEAIERWRQHPVHRTAKSIAKSKWFGATITRIARVEADYGFNLD